jgi:hypothetical protein
MTLLGKSLRVGAVVLAALPLLAFVLAAALVAFAGCSKRPPAPSATLRVLSPWEVMHELPGAITGDTAYAEVNSAWLKSFYPEFRAEIFRQGVVEWDERFDCNHFASYYVALAQTRFFIAAWGKSTPAQTLALGTFWYFPKRSRPGNGHAIVCALTERGLLFIEPQSGKELTLTAEERASVMLTAF